MRRVFSTVRRTGRGRLQKQVKEIYLREDVACGVAGCSACVGKDGHVMGGNTSGMVLYVVDPRLIPDQLHALGHDAVLPGLVLLQSTLASLPPRVRTRVRAELRPGAVLLHDDLMADVRVERRPGESERERAVRALDVGAAWLERHLAAVHDRPPVVKVLTYEALTKVAADLAKVAPDLPDLVAPYVGDDVAETGGAEPGVELHEEYWTDADAIERAKRNGSLFTGRFRAAARNAFEGRVQADDFEAGEIFVSGPLNINRAIDGDTVMVLVLPREDWTAPSHVIVTEEDTEESRQASADSHKPKKMRVDSDQVRPTGRIVGIVERPWRTVPGALVDAEARADVVDHGSVSMLFAPLDMRLPRVRIRTRQAERLVGKRFLVAIDGWARGSRSPEGHFVELIGDIGDLDTESRAILLQYDIPTGDFSPAIQREMPKAPLVVSADELARRRDLRRAELICSIDPPGCTDIDDALSCRVLPNGNYAVGVHIADVSHFVAPDSAADVEAAERGNTMYLVERRINMLPGILGENLCSLRGGEDRLAFSVMWEMTPRAEIVGVEFFKSLICSNAALTYAQAQERIDDPLRGDELTLAIRRLNSVAKILRERRVERGALTLQSMEVRFQRDEVSSDPSDMRAYEQHDTNRLVEEFMLLANVTVAEKIDKHFPQCAMLRRHPVPDEKNFEPLLETARVLGLDIRVASSKELSQSLNAARESYSDPTLDKIIRIWTTRCMSTAVYFSSGTQAPADFVHYGLASPIYTHFTSPIRRYADLVVHRQLAAAIGAAPPPPRMDKLAVQRMCATLNRRHKNAQYAGRASAELHTVLFFRSRVEQADGYVVKVKANGVVALIPRYGIEGLVKVSGAVFDPDRLELSVANVCLRPFSKMRLEISVDSASHIRPVLALKSVDPPLN